MISCMEPSTSPVQLRRPVQAVPSSSVSTAWLVMVKPRTGRSRRPRLFLEVAKSGGPGVVVGVGDAGVDGAGDGGEGLGAHDELEGVGGAGFVVVDEAEDGHAGAVGEAGEGFEGLADFAVAVGVELGVDDGHEGVEDHQAGAGFFGGLFELAKSRGGRGRFGGRRG
jgi:hypothetical protein